MMINNLDEYIIDYNLIKKYEEIFLLKNKILPIISYDIYTLFAVCSASSTSSLNENNIKTIEVDEEQILFYLNNLDVKKKLYELIRSKKEEDIKEFFLLLLKFAISKNSSDIHFESCLDLFHIRFRIDGCLKVFFSFEISLFSKLCSFVKVQTKLDITQNRLPQNGRFSFLINKFKYDFRVSFMPTILGQSLVIRILNDFILEKDLNNIGFTSSNLKEIKKSIKDTKGLVLVTGPTGSGKTTTLYSMINELNDSSKKIITIEDPIEYQIKAVQQIAINDDIGLSFSKILKDVLRQDPDIILIGEIRDEESLSLAIQASLTGHLVLSTLHTKDAISTINRLYDLKAKSFLISDTLKTIIAQRLVLKLCECDNGCVKCNFTSFNGRVMISEVLNINRGLRELISSKSTYDEIKIYLKTQNFIFLEEDAKVKVKENLTTLEEVYKEI